MVGEIVRFVMPSGPGKGEDRPALVTHVHDATTVNLTLFYDGFRDGQLSKRVTEVVERCRRDDAGQVGTWRPREAPCSTPTPS